MSALFAAAWLSSCLPQDDLSSYSRAWTSEPAALTPAPPEASDAGARPPNDGAGEATGASGAGGEPPSSPPAVALDASVPLPDASVPADAGSDAALDAGSDETPAPDAPVDAGSSRGLSGDAGTPTGVSLAPAAAAARFIERAEPR